MGRDSTPRPQDRDTYKESYLCSLHFDVDDYELRPPFAKKGPVPQKGTENKHLKDTAVPKYFLNLPDSGMDDAALRRLELAERFGGLVRSRAGEGSGCWEMGADGKYQWVVEGQIEEDATRYEDQLEEGEVPTEEYLGISRTSLEKARKMFELANGRGTSSERSKEIASLAKTYDALKNNHNSMPTVESPPTATKTLPTILNPRGTVSMATPQGWTITKLNTTGETLCPEANLIKQASKNSFRCNTAEAPFCTETFTTYSQMLVHQSLAHGICRAPRSSGSKTSTQVTCKVCKQSFSSDKLLIAHGKEKHNVVFTLKDIHEPKILGSLPPKILGDNDPKKKDHLEKCKKALQGLEDTIEQKMAAELKSKGFWKNPISLHKCDQCNRYFRSPREVKEHVEKAHGVAKRYHCKVCFETFLSDNLLKEHEKSKHSTNWEIEKDPEAELLKSIVEVEVEKCKNPQWAKKKKMEEDKEFLEILEKEAAEENNTEDTKEGLVEEDPLAVKESDRDLAINKTDKEISKETVSRCYVTNCPLGTENHGQAFHPIPTVSFIEERKKWLELIGRSEILDHICAIGSICSIHFDEADYKEDSEVLLEGAVPKYFLNWPDYEGNPPEEKNEFWPASSQATYISATPYNDETGISTAQKIGRGGKPKRPRPKKPMNTFMIWSLHYRRQLTEGLGDGATVSKHLASGWNKMTEEEMNKFKDEAVRLRALHKMQHPYETYHKENHKYEYRKNIMLPNY